MKNKYDHIISLGENCQTAITLRALGLRNEAFPFDWQGVRNFDIAGSGGFSKKNELICNQFQDFFDENNYEEFFETWETEHRLVYNNKTGLQFLHEFPKNVTLHEHFPVFVQKYQKRIDRLYRVLNSNHSVLFVFIEFFANLSDNEIIDSCQKLNETFPAKIEFLIIKNDSGLPKWQINERQLSPDISLYSINNDFSEDWKEGNGNIGNKILYRRVIHDFVRQNFVDCKRYNDISHFIHQTKKDFNYLGWKVNEVIPDILQKINKKLSDTVTYQNGWEKEFLKKYYKDFDVASSKEAVMGLLRGLPEQSVKNVEKVIGRIKQLRDNNFSDIDIFSEKEQKEILDADKSLKNIIMLQDNIYCHNGYFLPKNHFESVVFEQKLHIDDIPVPLKGKTDIIDVGAYIGDSALILNNLCPRKIWAFEANPQNCMLIEETLKLNNIDNVQPVNLALGDCKGQVILNDDDACSSITSVTEDNSVTVQMDTLDNFIKANTSIRVGLIKVDIEGAEQNFLLGAKEVIKKHKPILMISIYHSWNDFINIKNIIESWNVGYKFIITKPACGSIVLETSLIAYIKE